MIRNFLASIDPLLKVGGDIRELLTLFSARTLQPRIPKLFGRPEKDQNRPALKAPVATTILRPPSNLVVEIDMPGKYLDNACVDCQKATAALNIRNRQLCHDCLIKYVQSKVLKRMEPYRLKDGTSKQKRKLLLPVSGGVSSLVLLQVLDFHIQRQLASRGRAAYGLEVLIVDTSCIGHVPSAADLVESLKEIFPSHHFTLLPLDTVFDMDHDLPPALSDLGFHGYMGEEPRARLERLMRSATTPTTRSDLFEILLQRLIVCFSKSQGCEGILWGHSDSRLAAVALSNVAKGRGGSLPNQIGDGPSPRKLYFNYPLRDLFKSELEIYAGLLPAQLAKVVVPNLLAPIPSSIRETSIDDLLTNYITSQGQKYPSIMANVVRTTSKLQMPSPSEIEVVCRLCTTPITSVISENSQSGLCYGCSKIKADIKTTSIV